MPDGEGTITYADGSTYTGQWAEGRIEGQGRATLADGVVVAAGDLLIDVSEMGRFEEENELMRRAHAGKGPEPKFDWDGFWRAVAIYVHEHGVPPTLKEFVATFEGWFLDQSNGAECPSDSVIRKKLSPLWNELRREK